MPAYEPLQQIAWTYGPMSTVAVVAGCFYAWKTKKTGDDQMELWSATTYHPAPQASLIKSTPGHIELSNAHGGHHAYVHGLRGLHRAGENSDVDVEYPWGLVEASFPAALPPGGSLICKPLKAVLSTHPIHRLEAELSWSAKPHRNLMTTVTVLVSAPTC